MNNYKNELIIKSNGLLTEALDISVVELIKLMGKNPDFLKDIPVVKWAYTSYEIYNNIKVAHFIKKYAHFLGPINEEFIDKSEIDFSINECVDNEKELEKLIDYTFIALTNYQTEFKAKILGRLFTKTIKDKIFTIEEYNILLFSIENIHPITGFPLLKKYYELYLNFQSIKDNESNTNVLIDLVNLEYYPLSTSGLINLPKGGTYAGAVGGAFISQLGIKFFENCIQKYPET